jgi:hypothetical protein
MLIVSIPLEVRLALWNEPNPIISFVSRLMLRSFCSILLFRYLLYRNSVSAASISSAFKALPKNRAAAFLFRFALNLLCESCRACQFEVNKRGNQIEA